MLELPPPFWSVRYVAARYPGNADGLEGGANCQHFAYEVLRHHGFELPNLRSSELWDDRAGSIVATEMCCFDLVLFNDRRAAYGAHVGVAVDDERVLHLCREVGTPVIWPLAEFAAHRRYSVKVGVKRPIRRGNGA